MWSIGLFVALDNVIAGLVVEATIGDVRVGRFRTCDLCV
jgi:hypothetical protein